MKREMRVLSLGLPRTGTASMAKALEILGYENVFHGLKIVEDQEAWQTLDRASDAEFPTLPTSTGKPFNHDDWEEIYGPYDATTDVASFFASSLIDSYPDAKVVLVIRDYDKWFRSFDEGIIQALWCRSAEFSIRYVEPVLNSVAGQASRKMTLGFLNAQGPEEGRRNAREAYDRHHEMIRKAVPPDQLLELQLGEGWERLCAFLGKPVPNVPFPRVNDAEALKQKIREVTIKNATRAATRIAPWLVGAVGVGAGAWIWASKSM